MRISRLSSRDRRALLLGTGVLVPALFFMFAAKPYLQALTDTRDELQRERQLLIRERTVLADTHTYPDLMDRTEVLLERHVPRLFSGSDEPTWTSAVADYVREVAVGNRVVVQSIEGRNARRIEGGLMAIEVEIDVVSDLEGLLSFLYVLEEGVKLVQLDQLSIERSELAGTPPSARVLRLTAMFRGYALLPEQVDISTGEGDTVSPPSL